MKNRKMLFNGEQKNNEINISPLIDIVFILLIFFIVTTVFVEETGVEVQRPRASSSVDLEKNSILIAITDDGRIVYGGEEIGVNGVRGMVRRLIKREQMPVIIQSDKRAPVELYARVHDEASLAGAKNINLATSQN